MSETGEFSEELRQKGEALLAAAQEYWDTYGREVERDAVVWLQGDDGALVVFTRGEYREHLKHLIGSFGR